MNLSDAYALLGASQEDSNDAVKKKYHKLVMLYHPDKHIGGDIEYATKKTQEINAAYERIIHSRSNESKSFDWGSIIKVTYSRPPRPKGLTNLKANIPRSTYGYSCDFWNVWNPKEESDSAFCSSLFQGVMEKIRTVKTKNDLLFLAPIIDRMTYFGAAEYVDPYVALCTRFDVEDLSDAVIFPIITRSNIKVSRGTQVLLAFDRSLLGQPYAISFYTTDGVRIGSIQSMESVCVSLLKEHLGATITGTVSSVVTFDEYDSTLKKRVPTKSVHIRLHISLDTNRDKPFSFVNHRKEIDGLLDMYSTFSRYSTTFLKGKQFGNSDIETIYLKCFTKVKKPEITEEPIYTLDYRVYERDARDIDGRALCKDFSRLDLLNSKEKELLLYAFGASQKSEPLKKVCNTTTKYYQYNGEKVCFVIRLYKQKNPNYENGSDIMYWHNVRLCIYSKE